MLYSDIKEKYKGEWVLLGDPKYSNSAYPDSGTVVYHNIDQKKVWQKVENAPFERVTIVYGGTFPEEPDKDFMFML